MPSRSEKFRYKIAQYSHDIPRPKNNEIVIVPQDNRVVDFPPYVGSSQLPSWWKDLNKGRGSIRRCQGTYDYVTYGLMMPLWTNITIRPNMNNTMYDVKSDKIDDIMRFPIEGFNSESAQGCPIEHNKSLETGQYIKLVSPWRFITAKNVSLMTLPMLFEPDPRYSVVAGIVHTDYYHQINVVIIPHTNEEFTIPVGTPIQHMVPVRRDHNFKDIVWGNESMYKFVAHSGLGDGHLVYDNDQKSSIYRRLQRKSDLEKVKEKKWYEFFK